MTAPSTVVEIVSPATLRSRIDELGSQLASEYAGKLPVFVGILNGSVPFLADLTRSSDLELEVDFLGLTRFGEGGRVDIAYDCATDLPSAACEG